MYANEPSTGQLIQTGHAILDADHESLAALIDALRTASAAQLLEAFDALHAELREHFATEDALMAPYNFSSRECHLDEHAAVLRSFDEVRPAIASGQIILAQRFAAELERWLPEHVDALDRNLAKFLFFRETGGAPVLLARGSRP